MPLALLSEIVMYVLFLGWIATGLILLLLRHRMLSWERKFLGVVTGIGLLLCAYEAYMTLVWSKTVVAPIRIDLLMIVPFLCVAYAAAGFLTIRNIVRDRPGAGVRIPVLVLSAFLLALPTWNLGRLLQIFQSGRELTARFISREQQLFEARFRDPQTFERRFGKISTSGTVRELSGHWVADRPIEGITRFIINDLGQLSTFRECGRKGDVECLRGEGHIRIFDFSVSGRARIELNADTALPAMDIARSGEEKLKITLVTSNPNLPEVSGLFQRKPVPFQKETPETAKVTPLPPLMTTIPRAIHTSVPRGNSVEIFELRRWTEGEEMFAVLFYRSGTLGQPIQFIQPYFLRGKTGDSTTLTQVGDGVDPKQPVSLDIATSLSGARITLKPVRPAEPVELRTGTLIEDEIFELAPLTSLGDVEAWFRTQSAGKTFTVPAEKAK